MVINRLNHHQSWAKNNLPERKNLAHSSDHRGLQTVKEDEFLCSLIRTAHEIHYRWNQWRMNGNKLRWKCRCSSRCEKQQQNDRNNSEPWRSRIALRLKPPDTLPSGWDSCSVNTTVNWSDAHTKGERSTCQWSSEIPTLRTNWKDQLDLGSSLASNTASIRGCGPCTVNTFIHKHPKSPYCSLIAWSRILLEGLFTRASKKT